MNRKFSSLLIFTMVFSIFFSSSDWNATASGEEVPRFEAVDITDTTATLEWDPIDGAVSYSLHLFETELLGFTPDKFSHDVTGLTPNMAQVAILYYKDAVGETFEIRHEFTTDPLILAAPANLRVVNVTTNSAEIDWDDTPYALEYYISVDDEYVGRAESSLYTINDLTANTTYNVIVIASNLLQNSAPASLQITTTGSSWPDATAVDLRAVDVTATTATLVWNVIPTATEYHLADGEGFEQSVTAATYGLTGLSPNTEYTFSLIASNAIVSSSAYTYTFTTAPASPTAPTGLTATAGDAQVSLAWDTVTGAGNTYNVKRSTTSGGSYATIAANETAATYKDTTAVNGTAYYYVVTTVNQGLESANSNEVSAQPAATVVEPTPPVTEDDSTIPSDGNNSTVILPTPPVTEDGSTNPSDDNNNTVVLTVTSTIEQTADGKSVSKITVDPADLQKAVDSMKSASGTPKIIIQVPGNDGATNVQLKGAMVADIIAQVPSAVITVQYDTVTYDLPAEVVDIPAIAKELGTEAEDIKINITIDKVSGATAAAIESSAKQSGLQQISDAVDFKVTAESESTGQSTPIDDFGNTYVRRSVNITAPVDASKVTGVLYNPTTGQLSFVPATFSTQGGNTVATLKRNGNSIYTVVQFTKTFEDLNGHWAKAEVELLASKLVVKGVSANRFEPENEITRAEFASLLVRAMGISEDNTSRFPDVKSTDWFAGAVNAAAKAGFVDGFEDGTFRPSANITREQMAVMITRAMSFAGQQPTADAKGLAVFIDSSFISSWAKDAVAQSVSASVINGRTATTFSPKENASRAEAVVMLKRMLQILQFIN